MDSPTDPKLNLQRPRTEHEFLQMMEIVDSHLRGQATPIHARPIRGLIEISKALGESLVVAGQRSVARKGNYSGDCLSAHVYEWFDARYGDKLKTHFGPGRIVILVRGDPWEVLLPKIWGGARFVATRDARVISEKPVISTGTNVVNVIDLIHLLPDGLRDALTDAELAEIGVCFAEGYGAMRVLHRVQRSALVEQALSDLDIAVHSLVSKENFGNARWSALQATEKMLKAYIESRGERFPRHHRLDDLVNVATRLGLSRPDDEAIAIIQTGAGIRYTGGDSDLRKAYCAYRASLKLSGEIAHALA